MATKKFRCKVCGYIHIGDAAPAKCPTCQAPASEFEEITEKTTDAPKKSKGINTNSNSYTIIYASVMVIIVAFLLAFVSSALKETQDANVDIDKKQQILSSLNLRNIEKDSVEIVYAKVVKNDMVFGSDVTPIKDGELQGNGGQHDQQGFKIANKEITDSNRPLYVCEVDGKTKYVIPVSGAGLWGGIWGYIAVDDDCQTVYGAYFSHESETAGLGDRITEEWFQTSFNGKKLFAEGSDEIALSVIKKGKAGTMSPDNYVDGITGATLTSDGVHNMVKDCLSRYKDILTSYKK